MKPIGVFLLFVLSGCNEPLYQTQAWQAQTWQAQGSSLPPTVATSADCHDQARRQANDRYPSSTSSYQPTASFGQEGDRTQAEIKLFDQCMREKGFARS
jgi:hypothetical protein